MRKPRKGDIVALRFLDHVEDGDKPMECCVYGRLACAPRKFYTVDSWHYGEGYDFDDNVKRFVILMACVEEVRILT